MDQLLTAREVSEILRLNSFTIKRMARKKELRCVRINTRGDYRFFREDIEKLMGTEKKCSVCGLDKIYIQHLEPAGDEVSDESYYECPNKCEEA